jgi:hypothetical protein
MCLAVCALLEVLFFGSSSVAMPRQAVYMLEPENKNPLPPI